MQMLDQQVAAALAVPEQRLHLGERGGIDLAALRLVGAAPPARAGVDAAIMGGLGTHRAVSTTLQDGLSAAKPITNRIHHGDTKVTEKQRLVSVSSAPLWFNEIEGLPTGRRRGQPTLRLLAARRYTAPSECSFPMSAAL
jgi:hypothetical protein